MSNKPTFYDETCEQYLHQMAALDLKDRAVQLGAIFSHQALEISFYSSPYRVSPKGVFDADGKQANVAVSVALCRYILQCPKQMPANGDWVTYREFKGAGPLLGSFTANTHKIIETQFGGHLKELRRVAEKLGGTNYVDNAAYDLSMIFNAMPRVPVLLRFNDRDETFPAQSTLLFRQSAEMHLDLESLSIVGTFLAGALINK